MKKAYSRYLGSFVLLAALVLVLLIWNINAGSVHLPVGEILRILTGHGADSTQSHIVWDIRLPRILSAMLLGGALSVSGFLLQTFFANPMGFILLISNKVKKMSMLVISGVMIGYICSAITDFVVTFADDSNIVNLHNWSLGSFSGLSWENVAVMAAVVGVALILTFLLSKPIGAYQMGEVYAQNMGVNIRAFRVVLILLSSVLSACVTAFAGPISFVGIAVPHLVKSLFRTAKPIVIIPACFLGGAVFCLFCDLIARTVFAPTELSISSVTAVFGAPVVIYMMVSRRTKSIS